MEMVQKNEFVAITKVLYVKIYNFVAFSYKGNGQLLNDPAECGCYTVFYRTLAFSHNVI